MSILLSCTHPRWFAACVADLPALLSDHLHCERKAAENALSLVRRYPHRSAWTQPGSAWRSPSRGGLGTLSGSPSMINSVDALARLAHEETSHVIQVGALMARRGWTPRSDTPNHYARALLAEVRTEEPARLVDALLVAAFIEARSHERLGLLARGFAEAGEAELADLYEALAGAEERHAETFLELAAPLVAAPELEARVAELGAHESAVLAALPHASRIH